MSKIANTRQIRLVQRTSSYWRVTFDNPPLNIFGPETIPELNEIVTALETDEDVKVVVFDSAVEGFFLTHYNFLAKPEETTSLLPGPTGLSPRPWSRLPSWCATPDYCGRTCHRSGARAATESTLDDIARLTSNLSAHGVGLAAARMPSRRAGSGGATDTQHFLNIDRPPSNAASMVSEP